MTLLAIFSTIRLVDPLLDFLIELYLLRGLALLQQLGDLYIFVLAKILSLDLEHETLIFINLTIFKFINGLLNLVVGTIIATCRQWGAFARQLDDSLRLLRAQKLQMLRATARPGQLGQPCAIVLSTLEHGGFLVLFQHFGWAFRLHRCLLLYLLVKCGRCATSLAGVHCMVGFRGGVDSKRETLLLHGRHEVG